MTLKNIIIFSFIFLGAFVITSQPTHAFFQDYQEAEYAVGSDEFKVENSQHYLSESLYLYTDSSDWYLMEIDMVEKHDTRIVFVGTVIDAKVERMLGRDMAASLPTAVVQKLPDNTYFYLLPTEKL